MRVRRMLAVAVLAAAAILGCASAGSNQPKLVWVRDDGAPAEREEILAARDACTKQVEASKIQMTRRWGHIEYAGQVVDCIKSKGFHLVDAPEE